MNDVIVDTNLGQVAQEINNHYHCTQPCYALMSLAQLLARREHLRGRHKAARHAFLRHRTVPGFFSSALVLAVFWVGVWGTPPTFVLASVFFTLAVLTLVTGCWMIRARRHIFQGLQSLKKDLIIINGYIAVETAAQRAEVNRA